MKKTVCVLIGLIFMLCLSGCFNKKEKAAELADYLNGYTEVEDDYELGSLHMIGLYRGSDNNMDEDKLKDELTDQVLPGLEKRLEYLESVDLEYKDIQELNTSMTKHIKNGEDVFKDLNEKLQNGTDEEINDAKDELKSYISDGDYEGKDIYDEMDDLIDKYDVLVVTDYDDDGEEYQRFDKGK